MTRKNAVRKIERKLLPTQRIELLTSGLPFKRPLLYQGRHEAKYARVSQFVMEEKNFSRISMLAQNNGKKIANLLFRLAPHVRQAPPSSVEYFLRREMGRKCAWKGRDKEI